MSKFESHYGPDIATKINSLAAAPDLSTDDAVSADPLVVTAQAQTIGGDDLEQYRLLRVWLSDTDGGSPDDTNVDSITFDPTNQIEEVVSDADYWQVTGDDGEVEITVTLTTDGEKYLMVADGAAVSSIKLEKAT